MLLQSSKGKWEGVPLSFREAVSVRAQSLLLSPERFQKNMRRFTDEKLEATLDRLHREGRTELQQESDLAALVSELFSKPLQGKPSMPYTYRHSAQVSDLLYILSSELLRDGVVLPSLLSPRAMAKLAGHAHDNGKAFLRRGLLGIGEQMPVRFLGIQVWPGRLATPVEKELIQKGHLDTGMRFLSALSFPGQSLALKLVGCHHINFDGQDHPKSSSYPEGKAGKDLSIEERAMKLCDMVSAVLPRFYRKKNTVKTLEEAVIVALAVAGKEVDPFLLPYLLRGIYGMPLSSGRELVEYALHTQPHREDLHHFHHLRSQLSHHALSRECIRRVNRTRLLAYQQEILDGAGSSVDRDLALAASIQRAYGTRPVMFP